MPLLSGAAMLSQEAVGNVLLADSLKTLPLPELLRAFSARISGRAIPDGQHRADGAQQGHARRRSASWSRKLCTKDS